MTQVAIVEDKFYIDGAPTYPGRSYRDWPIEGLLLNTRMIQATFDDANRETRARWAYPDTGVWDAERNVREFIDTLPVYREHGVLAVTVNFQTRDLHDWGSSPLNKSTPKRAASRSTRRRAALSASAVAAESVPARCSSARYDSSSSGSPAFI